MLTVLLIMLVGALPVYFMIFFFAFKYRSDKKNPSYSPDMDSKWGSALVWAIPGTIIIVLSVINWKTTHALDPGNQIASPNPPLTIQVVALQWKFLFIYPKQNIATVNFIEFPVNTPLNFQLTADGPMSSFWIPQLGSQIYAMSAMQTQLNLMASKVGDFRGMDTEINGAGFSGMKFIARSATDSDFNTWLNSIKQSGNELTLDSYNNLAQPSSNNPVASYSSVEEGLYNNVMMKYMMPQSEMPAMGTTSPNNSMPGMNMSGSYGN